MIKKLLCKKNNLKKTTSTKNILVLVFLLLALIVFTSPTHSYNIEPSKQDFLIEVEEEKKSQINFTNTTEAEQEFEIYSHRYDAQKQEIIEEKNFISLNTINLELEAGETGTIEYEIEIPKDTLPGSYFSIIVVENINPKENSDAEGISINYGLGSLIALHVIDDTSISEVFLNETETSLSYKKPLNPFDTEIEYTIKNNSKYVFLPSGQLTLASKESKPIFYEINQEDEERLYPGEELSFTFKYEGDYEDLVSNKIAKASVGMQYSNTLKEDEIDLPYFDQTVKIGSVVIAVLLISTVSIIYFKKRNLRRRIYNLFRRFKRNFRNVS